MILLLERVLNKVANSYREICFQRHIGQQLTGLKIYGKIKLINYNVQIGKNLKIYPDVMINGDGPIVIGDNVSIGNGTVMYASRGGNNNR